MPKMYHPDTQEVVVKGGKEVKEHKEAGFIVVGNRPEEEYMGKTRDELKDDDDEMEEEEVEEEEEDATPEV